MSASAIGWIVSIVFIVILVIGFFIGFWRGLKRSTASLIFGLVGALLAFFLTPVITKAILGINITADGTQTSINNYLVEMIKSASEDIEALVNANPNLESFFAQLPSALANVVVFIVLTAVVELIMYIIYKIIASIFLKYKPGAKKHRITGGVVGAVKTLIIVVFAFMPLSALIGTLNNIMYEDTYFVEQVQSDTTVANAEDSEIIIDDGESEDQAGEGQQEGQQEGEQATEETKVNSLIDEYIPSEVKNVISGLENNALIKISKVFGLDNYVFDYLSQVTVDGEKVQVRKDIENVYPMINFVYQLRTFYDEEGLVNLKNADLDRIEKYFNNFVDSGLFQSVLASTVANVIENYQDYAFIANSQIVQEYGIILDDLKANLSSLTTTKEKGEYFASDFKNLFSAFKTLAKSGTLDQVKDLNGLNEILNVLTNDENITVLQSALENVFSMNTIQDSISSVIKVTFEKILNEEVSDLEDSSNYTDEQWKNLSAKFTNILKMVGDINSGFSGGLEGVIKDPESILDESSGTLPATLSSVGSLLDELLNIDLFKTTTGENTTIFDGILTNYNLTLPSGTVLKVNTNESGELVKEEVTISSYKELFEFITPTLITVKDNDLYNIITSGSDAQSLLQTLADKIAKNEEGAVVGDRYLLHKIILPLYQIEFTNELIVSNLQTALGADEIITFANIDTLAEWGSELDYISDLITKVNTTSVNIGSQEDPDNQTYLQIILSGDYNTLINNLQEEDVDGIFRPVLEAQCTENLKVQVLDLISTNIQKVTNAQTTIPTDNASQNVDEIIEIIKSFISLNKVLSETETTINSLIENPDNTDVLGETLNTIRDMVLDENGDIDENSAFGGVLDDLVGTIRNEYNDVLLENEDIAQELADSNLQNVDFVDVLNRLRDVIG